MSLYLVQALILAAVSDGEIQEEERLLLQLYKNKNPLFKNLPQSVFDDAQISLFNKVQNGLTPRYIIEEIGTNLSKDEKEIAFSLAHEICASNHAIEQNEQEILDEMKKSWKLSTRIINAVELSTELRYGLSLAQIN